jgi:hypothetical protein
MVGTAIDKILIPQSASLVAEYYNDEGEFAGVTFEVLGANDPERVDLDDLLALTFLDVAVSPLGVRTLLGAESAAVSHLLSAIPADVALWNADDATLDRAELLWNRLQTIPSVGFVTAGKLLARKRPQLFPVIDKWVIAALGAPTGTYWRAIREALSDEQRRARIELCRGETPSSVSTLRLLDVIIWMQFSESDNARDARARVGLPVVPRRSAHEEPATPARR